MAILELKSVTLSLGGPPVLVDVDLRVEKGDHIALLGRNGEGKSTLLRLLSAALAPDSGEILRTAGLRIGLMPQEVPADLGGTVGQVVAAALADLPGGDTPWEMQHLVEQAVTRAGLAMDADFATLSTGAKRRALLARALVIDPDVLLLDEPTNHLDVEAITWLESELQRFRGTLLFVTHDRAFLRGLAGRIVELDRGRLRDWACDYPTFLVRRDAVMQTERQQWAQFDKKLAQEEAWIRQGILARRTRNEGRVRSLMQMREERRDRRVQTGDVQMPLQEADRSGRLVIRAERVNFAWGDRTVVDDFSGTVLRGDKVGILGPNGSGKTTLLRLLLGELSPAGGQVHHGTNLAIAYFDQQRAQLDETATVQENVGAEGDTVIVDGRPVHIISYLGSFLFSPDRARAPITRLSGGERNRLLLARLFARPANLLVLDEPTNDLDLETLELLEELLGTFAGTILLVSHDREFLDNVTTSTLALAGDGRVVETVGGYSDWLRTARASAEPRAERGERKTRPTPSLAAKPRRLGYREQQELAALPGRIEALEIEQARVRTRLADPHLYRDAGDTVAGLRDTLAGLEGQLAALYSRWTELDAQS